MFDSLLLNLQLVASVYLKILKQALIASVLEFV